MDVAFDLEGVRDDQTIVEADGKHVLALKVGHAVDFEWELLLVEKHVQVAGHHRLPVVVRHFLCNLHFIQTLDVFGRRDAAEESVFATQILRTCQHFCDVLAVSGREGLANLPCRACLKFVAILNEACLAERVNLEARALLSFVYDGNDVEVVVFQEEAAIHEFARKFPLDYELGDIVHDLRTSLIQVEKVDHWLRIARVFPVDQRP